MNYRTEFPDFDDIEFDIPEGFEDTSWHNDAMPSFTKALPNGRSIRIWVNSARPGLREVDVDGPRFRVEAINEAVGLHFGEYVADLWANVLTYAERLEQDYGH